MKDVITYAKALSAAGAILLLISGWMFSIVVDAVKDLERRQEVQSERLGIQTERITRLETSIKHIETNLLRR